MTLSKPSQVLSPLMLYQVHSFFSCFLSFVFYVSKIIICNIFFIVFSLFPGPPRYSLSVSPMPCSHNLSLSLQRKTQNKAKLKISTIEKRVRLKISKKYKTKNNFLRKLTEQVNASYQLSSNLFCILRK